ncbi:MAG: hypothetical protein GWN84_07475 [Gammaproteobacteria bacterium]|nr:hypothetical protein [Gammaproteobacteria bacterium]NIR82722.1 hypothetical protein [Gammaproteobacteria bacterium]NIR89586.1 hypothetical protein [Gammaproteobacteria bacterium]NIU03882.1 hypothetical protein [Gammaproteobacteria bacterium]NIV51198.1 hypothetical protein [Gammaproteobacteria bacterium]
MRIGIKSLLLASLGAVLLHAPLEAPARIKCWTNDQGVRECGDAVPPEYAQQAHDELNKRGVTVDRTARAKTPEEIEAEKRRQEELKEQERREHERAKRDRVLLATFTTEEELLLARDSRLQAIEARITHTKQLIAKLEDTRGKLRSEAAKHELGGNPVPDDLQHNLAEVERQIESFRDTIEQYEQEKEELREKFARDLARYRALRDQRASE